MPKPTHRSAKAAAALTSEIVEIFGAPPLLSTEDGGACDDMLAKLANAIHPGDVIACLLIKDIADKRTEIARCRRQKQRWSRRRRAIAHAACHRGACGRRRAREIAVLRREL